MTKYKYVQEFEIQASPKMIFPYLSTAIGLEQWFSEVKMIDGKIFNFIWDNTNHYAKMTMIRVNKQIKFEFVPDESGEIEEEAASYIELKLENSELTNTTFMKVIDYSEMTEEADLEELWQGLVHKLKEIIGG
ncbi:MAG: ATPase [Cytophagales bacterium]|nr:MAG: ATPase [Cytophagales bacterium]